MRTLPLVREEESTCITTIQLTNNKMEHSRRFNKGIRSGRGNPNQKEMRQVGGVGRTPKKMHPKLIVPPYSVHKLTYKSDLTLITAGATFFAKSFKANSLFDPDPAILTTNYTGYEWLTQAYDEYLVQTSRARCWAGNQNGTFVSFGLVYSLEQLDSTISTWQDARDALENKFSTKTTQLSQKGVGGCSRSIMGKCALQDLTKAGVYQYSDIYAGITNMDPTYLMWVTIVAFADDGTTNLGDGVIFDFTLESTAEFYSPKQMKDTTTLRQIRKPVEKDDANTITLDLGKASAKYRYIKPISRQTSESDVHIKMQKQLSAKALNQAQYISKFQ